jgi:acyl-ACP thioesterase
MKAQGWLWILARIRVEISRYPARRESVAIETWPRELMRVFAMRDFLVRNLENEVIARATSAWLILNAEQGRPLRPETIVDSARFAPNAGVRAVQSDPSKLSSPGVDAGEIARFAVTPSDIDVNKHVNNAVYMRWIDDALRIRRDDRSIDTIELNFMQAGTYPGDVSVVAELGNPTVGEIRGDDAGEPLVRFSLDRGPESGVP